MNVVGTARRGFFFLPGNAETHFQIKAGGLEGIGCKIDPDRAVFSDQLNEFFEKLSSVPVSAHVFPEEKVIDKDPAGIVFPMECESSVRFPVFIAGCEVTFFRSAVLKHAAPFIVIG